MFGHSISQRVACDFEQTAGFGHVPPGFAQRLLEHRLFDFLNGESQREESALCGRIGARIARIVNWPLENGEGLQVLHYLPGAEYKPHHDYFDPAKAGTPAIVKRGGQRVGTVHVNAVTDEDILGMIIMGKTPPQAV